MDPDTQMTEIKLYILSIIGKANDGKPVSIPIIDMRLMQKYPEVIYESRLMSILTELSDENYIEFGDKLSVKITEKGKYYLTNCKKL